MLGVREGYLGKNEIRIMACNNHTSSSAINPKSEERPRLFEERPGLYNLSLLADPI